MQKNFKYIRKYNYFISKEQENSCHRVLNDFEKNSIGTCRKFEEILKESSQNGRSRIIQKEFKKGSYDIRESFQKNSARIRKSAKIIPIEF